MKLRRLPDANYSAIYLKGKTIRSRINLSQPIIELAYPEFYDVSLGNKCVHSCSYCYATSSKGTVYSNIVEKAKLFFGSMSENQRPFQLAIGGDSEPTVHPEFMEFIEVINKLGIVPNFTTAGNRYDDPEFMSVVKENCEGVAISLHPHLRKLWRPAIESYIKAGIRLNLHIVISNERTINWLWKVLERYKDEVDYVIALPYMSNRNAPKQEFAGEYFVKTLFANLEKPWYNQLAVGANAYPYIKDYTELEYSLYDPHAYSKYLLLNDPIGIYSDSHYMETLSKDHVLWNHTGNICK